MLFGEVVLWRNGLWLEWCYPSTCGRRMSRMVCWREVRWPRVQVPSPASQQGMLWSSSRASVRLRKGKGGQEEPVGREELDEPVWREEPEDPEGRGGPEKREF